MRNLRTYLAGLGSSGAIIGAVVAGFLALGTIVGFNGLPSTSSDSNSDAVLVEDSNAPEFAAVAAARPSGAPAANPARGGANAAGGGDGGAAAGSGPSSGDGTSGQGPTDGGADGPDGGNPGTTPPTEPTTPTPAPTPTSGGDAGHLVDEVDSAVNDVTGTDLNLGGATQGATDVVDNAVGGLTGGRGLGLDNVDVPKLPGVVDLSP